MNTQTRPTWSELVAHEPRLDQLLDECRHLARTRKSHWRHYSQVKNRVRMLVGWDSDAGDFLGSAEAYEVAMSTICEALDL
jgi:hypothetical protein